MSVDANADPDTAIFKIESQDGKIFDISGKAAKQSTTLFDLISNVGVLNDVIPVSNIDGNTIERIINWCEHHKEDPIPEENKKPQLNISAWDEEFFKLTSDELYHLIHATNFLDVKGLMHMACKRIADAAKGKSVEELRILFGIPTDEEDEAAERSLASDAINAGNGSVA